MNTTGFLYALGAAVTWGAVYALGQKVLQSVSPLMYLVITYLVGAVIVLPFVFLYWDGAKEMLRATKPVWGLILIVEILVFAANFFVVSSVKELGASLASALEICYPFFVALFTFLLFGTAVNIYFWLGAALIFAGAAIITFFA